MENYKETKLVVASPVKFIMAFTYSEQHIFQTSLEAFSAMYGNTDVQANEFSFDHTTYYEGEMGDGLKKIFVSFEKLGTIEKLIDLKYLALEVEGKFAVNMKRKINIDPAYLELSKLVVSSTKNFAHRIYIQKDIYGDLQLQYKGKKIVPLDWTFPDYKTETNLAFFTKVRNIYAAQLKEL